MRKMERGWRKEEEEEVELDLSELRTKYREKEREKTEGWGGLGWVTNHAIS